VLLAANNEDEQKGGFFRLKGKLSPPPTAITIVAIMLFEASTVL